MFFYFSKQSLLAHFKPLQVHFHSRYSEVLSVSVSLNYINTIEGSCWVAGNKLFYSAGLYAVCTVMLLWCLSTDCSADYLVYAEREQRERADRQSWSRWHQWFLYLLHHLYRGRSWSGERQRRSPRWKCRLGQLATTDDNDNKQQANNMMVKTQWVIRSYKMGQRSREKKRMKEKNSLLADDITGNKEPTENMVGHIM